MIFLGVSLSAKEANNVSVVSLFVPDLWSYRRGNKWKISGIVFGFEDMTHEDGVAGIGDDEKEEWMVDVETWWLTLKDVFGACCSRGLGPFFVNLKRQRGNCYGLNLRLMSYALHSRQAHINPGSWFFLCLHLSIQLLITSHRKKNTDKKLNNKPTRLIAKITSACSVKDENRIVWNRQKAHHSMYSGLATWPIKLDSRFQKLWKRERGDRR